MNERMRPPKASQARRVPPPRRLSWLYAGSIGAVLLSPATTLAGQTPETAPPAPAVETTPKSLQRTQPVQRVTLAVQDSSLNYVIRTIAQQARRAVIFNGNDPRFAKTVSINIQNKPVLEAITTLLKGTGLEAGIGPDGETIVIRAPEVKSKSAAVANGKIFGRVLDSMSRTGISGVTVTIVGLKRSTATRDDGTFHLTDIPVGSHSLSIKQLGYQSQIVTVVVESDKTSTTQVVLVQSSTRLTEVVTTATGSQRRIDISNDVVKIDADRLMEAAPIRTVTDLLIAAQVPGMVLTRSSGAPGAPVRIRFGGVGSISQNNDPVVIVDGVWVKSAFSDSSIARQLGSGSSGQYFSSRLDAIDPSTIESIEIVRGPAAATLYGPDAANGVIKITTKRGQPGPARWDVQFSRDWQKSVGTRQFEYEGFGHTETSTEVIRCTAFDVRAKACIQDSIVGLTRSNPLLNEEGRGFMNALSATVSGGSGQMLYSLTAGIRDRRGTREIPMIDRIRMRILSLPVANSFKNPNEMRDRSISSRLTMLPRAGLDITLNLDGTQTNMSDHTLGASGSLGVLDTSNVLSNPMNVAVRDAASTTTRGLISLQTNWTPRPWWMGSFTLGLDREYTRETRTGTNRYCVTGTCREIMTEDSRAGREASVYTMRAQTTVLPELGWASRFITIRPGVSFDLRREVNTRNSLTTTTQGDTIVQGNGQYDGPTTALAGLSVNANIKLFDRISFDPAIRRDFGGGRNLRNNEKTYPRFGTSWLVSDEPFFPKSRWMSTLRLRGAFGFAAVQPTLSQVRGRYVVGRTVVNGVVTPIINFESIGNPLLEPERSMEIETGFDADLFDDRMTVTVTYANKQNRNTLIPRDLAPSAGSAATRQENVARIVNQTTSIQVMGRVLQRENLSLRVTASFGLLNNEVKTLGPGVSPFGNFEQRYVAGYPVGSVWQQPILSMIDANGNGYLDNSELVLGDSLMYMGTNLPRYTAGYHMELGFLRHFTMNAFLDYKGAYIQNRNQSPFGTMLSDFDVNASIPDQVLSVLVGRTGNYRDLQTISELRLQSASISANIPPRLVRQLRAQSVQVSLQGTNLGLWTRYRGRDPGLNSSPIGERTTDNGATIGIPRAFSLQFRVRY